MAVGGDGTLSETADGLFGISGALNGQTIIAHVSCGTGNDFRRTLGIADGIDAGIERIGLGIVRRLDIGRIAFTRDDGTQGIRHFCNIASCGLSGETGRAVAGATLSRVLGAKGMFAYHVLATLIRYRFKHVAMTIDGAALEPMRICSVVFANGRFFGGGMMIAPDADLADAMLEVVVLGQTAKATIMAKMNLVYTGDHVHEPWVKMLRGRRIEISALEEDTRGPTLLDVDGEVPGRLPAVFEILPGALQMRC